MTDEEKEKKKNTEEGGTSERKAENKQTQSSKEEKTEKSETSENTDKTETPPDTSESEALKAENVRLKAQIEAYKTGFRSDTLEDAVLLAENIAKRDGVEISEALQTVAEKYPDWKNTENNGGFRVGAEPAEESNPNESRLDNAFGIRKKKGL
ncbi:MAG: hypothetical protein K2I06_06985 [Ruminococcus sp.]|nr:hypothetical protein [Ruminococcus sp.]